MTENLKIKWIFTDIGGVLLNNGWDRKHRASAVQKFQLEADEVDERHHLTYDTYESGKLTLIAYLDRIVFFKKRNFTKEEFIQYMFSLSEPIPEMIELIRSLKNKYAIPIAVVSNEGRELNEYRIQKFKLTEFIDFFISSSFVHFRKPDVDIFKLALDVAQVKPEEVVYIDDRQLFVQVANKLGINGIWHRNIAETKLGLAKYGLK